MSSFRHSYLKFRNKGEIKASLVFNAHGELRIPHLEETLLGKNPCPTWPSTAATLTTAFFEKSGIAPIGASFKIPGVVTIGF